MDYENEDDSGFRPLTKEARRIGVSPQTLRDAIRDGELPGYQPREKGLVYVKRAELDAWIEAGRIEVAR